MEVALADKLAEELSYYEWDGVISVSGYGEPLLPPHIGNIIKQFTTKGIHTRLVTSGDRILNKIDKTNSIGAYNNEKKISPA